MAIHEWSMRTASSSHLQLACNATYVALPFGRTSVGVWSLQSISSKPLELVGHSKSVSCLSFGSKPRPLLLCSAAEDYIIVWNIQKAREAYEEGNQIRGIVILTSAGSVEHLNFSPDDMFVAACIEKEVLILSTQRERCHTTLAGHTARVNSAQFSPHHEAQVVSISEDRTFKIWDISNNVLVYQSTIISGSPFSCLALDCSNEHLAIGSVDGQVRVYDMSEGNGYRLLHQVDVSRCVKKTQAVRLVDDPNEEPSIISSKPSWDTAYCATQPSGHAEVDEQSEAGEAILGLLYRVRPPKQRPSIETNVPSFLIQDASIVQDLLDVPPVLVVGTAASIVIISAYSYEVLKVIYLQEPIPSEHKVDKPTKIVSLVGSYCFSSAADQEQIWCVVGSIIPYKAHILRLLNLTTAAASASCHANVDGLEELQGLHINHDACTESDVTVLSCVPLSVTSPLRSEFVPKVKEDIRLKKSSAHKKTAITDHQPLTFQSRIKSSGYLQKGRQELFSPKTNKGKMKSMTKMGAGARALQKEYPLDAMPPSKLKVRIDVGEHATPIHQVAFSGDGQHIACAMANKCCVVFRMPLTNKGTTYTGHDASVNCVNWSHSNSYLVTGSNDKTVKMWSRSSSEPILTFQHVNAKPKTDNTTQQAKKNESIFTKEIRHAQFYYMDKFVVIATGNAFYLYKYMIDTTVDDIKRYQSHCHYKLVESYRLGQGQFVTTLSAVNCFFSYIVLCAGSDKSLEVFDMNVGKSIRIIGNAHDRPIHVIQQNQGSAYVSHPASAYDLFATAALTDAIKIWDLRTNRCVKRFEGHQNRVYPCGLSFSPCGKYIATGSEDRSAYIYDIRSGTYVEKLTGHVDVVTDVAYHPVYSELATSSLDGKLSLFTSR